RSPPETGRPAEALASHERARAILEKLADAQPQAKTSPTPPDAKTKSQAEPKGDAPSSKSGPAEKAEADVPKQVAEDARAKAQAEANSPPRRQEDQGPEEPFVDVASELEATRKPAIRTARAAFI